MHKLSIALLAFIAVASSALCADRVGLYFDSEATTNCLTDASAIGTEHEAFLILEECTAESGVAGWEGAISTSPGVFLLDISFPVATAINVSTPPEVMVGFSSPIPRSAKMCLATLRILALAPGEIFLHAAARPSLGGVVAPTYVSGGDPGELVAMAYSAGSPANAIATIGLPDCPDSVSTQAPLVQQELQLGTGVSIAMRQREIVVEPGAAQKGTVPDWNSAWRNSDVGVFGEISGFEAGCLEIAGRTMGIAKITILPQQIYWGPEVSAYTFYIEGVDVEACMSYGPNLRFDQYGQLEIGMTATVFGQYRSGVFWSGKKFVFLDTQAKGKGDVPGGVKGLRDVAESHEFANRVGLSDLFALVAPADGIEPVGTEYFFDPMVVYFGRDSLVGPQIRIEFPMGFRQFVGVTDSDARFLCLLSRQDNGAYRLTDGNKSIFIQTSDGFKSLNGMPLNMANMSGTGR